MKSIRIFLLVLLSIFASLGSVHSVAVMSVDLGSEWMKIAIVSPGVPMEVILNTDSQRKTPVVVAFREGERFIGDSALNVAVRFPEKTFTHFLDLLGKTSLNSVAVKKYLERFPYHTLVETDAGSVAFVLKDNGQETLYTPEELLSMLLTKARHYAEVASASSSPSGKAQIITDCVLTVPPYFSQAERKALKHAASLAGLKVLQLINSNAAFALNYGVFRRKDFNLSNPTNILFYDMGAGSAVASVASYQLVKTKERGYPETNPQLTIKGIGYDRYLGGIEFQFRLRDHLLKLFSEQSKKTMDEIRRNKRAMAKLLKEAGRLKKVLSANTEHRAQIENVMNDIDFKQVVTREEFETLAADLLNERVTKPLDDVFKSTGYTLAEIDSFIIIGGATRIPKVQQMIQEYWSRELSKNVNADEAGALGAAYQAAYLSKGFKVKTFHLKDASLYQINLDFETDAKNGNKRTISRTLFARGNTYPQKKVITFNKHRSDFDVLVTYVEPIPQDSEKNIFKISLKNVVSAFEKYSTNSSVEPKGIKVHFKMDESGVLEVENAEALFEVEYEEIQVDDNYEQLSNLVGDAISKFGSKISSLFGGSEASNETQSEGNATEPEKTVNETESKEKETVAPGANATGESGVNQTESVNATNGTVPHVKREIKKKTVREEISTLTELLDNTAHPEDSMAASREKLRLLDQREIEKLKRDQAKNGLESFIHESRDKLEQTDYASAVTEEERGQIETELRTVSEWLEYESDSSPAADFEQRLTKLNSLTKALFERVREHRERPEALAALTNMLNISEMFYANARNVSEEDQIFSEVELTNLRKLIDETKDWQVNSVTEQESTPLNTTPKLTLRAIAEKMAFLDREVKYLLNKARVTPPKKKVKKEDNKKENNTDSGDDKKSTTDENVDNDEAEKKEAKPKDETKEKSETKPEQETISEDTISPEKPSDIPPKTEL